MPDFDDPMKALKYFETAFNETTAELQVVKLVLSLLINQLRHNQPIESLTFLERQADRFDDPEQFRRLVRDILLVDDEKTAEILQFPK